MSLHGLNTLVLTATMPGLVLNDKFKYFHLYRIYIVFGVVYARIVRLGNVYLCVYAWASIPSSHFRLRLLRVGVYLDLLNMA